MDIYSNWQLFPWDKYVFFFLHVWSWDNFITSVGPTISPNISLHFLLLLRWGQMARVRSFFCTASIPGCERLLMWWEISCGNTPGASVIPEQQLKEAPSRSSYISESNLGTGPAVMWWSAKNMKFKMAAPKFPLSRAEQILISDNLWDMLVFSLNASTGCYMQPASEDS